MQIQHGSIPGEIPVHVVYAENLAQKAENLAQKKKYLEKIQNSASTGKIKNAAYSYEQELKRYNEAYDRYLTVTRSESTLKRYASNVNKKKQYLERVMTISHSIQKINNAGYSYDQELKRYNQERDYIGELVEATHQECD